MTLAEWKKRLGMGAQIRQISNSHGGDTGYVFTVTHVQTNAVAGTRSDREGKFWLEFPKRAEIEFTEKGFKRLELPRPGKVGIRVLAEYEWIESQEPPKP